jgi:hypothetical protein
MKILFIYFISRFEQRNRQKRGHGGGEKGRHGAHGVPKQDGRRRGLRGNKIGHWKSRITNSKLEILPVKLIVWSLERPRSCPGRVQAQGRHQLRP